MLDLKSVREIVRSNIGPYGRDLWPQGYPTNAAVDKFISNGLEAGLSKRFFDDYGRTPTESERNLFNNTIDFKDVFYTIRRAVPDEFQESIIKAVRNNDYGDMVQLISKSGQYDASFDLLSPKIRELDNLKRDYATIGEKLSSQDEMSVLNSSLEKIKETSSNILKNATERIVKKRITEIPEEELSAIRKSEQEAGETQAKFFEQTITPRIAQMLNARNLLDSGSLSTSLAKAAGELQTTRESVFNPLKTQAKLGGIQRDYENTIRGALEAGKSLSEATSFANNLYTLGQQQKFSAAQSDLSRGFQENQLLKQMQFQLANLPRTQSPSSMDYFLQYGLPLIGQIGGGALSGFLSRPKTATV